MTEKEIKDLLAVAKEVNHFRSHASGLICPICSEHLRGDVKSTVPSDSILYATLYCPSCSLFNVSGPSVSDVSDKEDGGRLSKMALVQKAISNIFDLVKTRVRLRFTNTLLLPEIENEDIPFLE